MIETDVRILIFCSEGVPPTIVTGSLMDWGRLAELITQSAPM